MNLEFGDYRYFGLLLAVLMLAFLLWDFIKWRKEKQNLFAEDKFQEKIFGKPSKFSKILPIIYVSAVILLVLAFVDIVRNQKTEIEVGKKSSNIIFLIDVSNSMNANDIEPSRLEQAKQILSQSLNKLTEEKIGIVAFAGEARSMMPLTTDYSSVDIYLENISSDLVKRQGTDFLLATEEAIKKLSKATAGAIKIILISDGEDNEGNHNAATQEAKKNGVIVTSVGIGTEAGATIPELQFSLYEDFKRDENGNVIITKRETQALKSIAAETGGIYIDGNELNKAVNDIVKDIQSTEKQTDTSKMSVQSTEHYYQWILAGALALLFIIYILNPKRDFNL